MQGRSRYFLFAAAFAAAALVASPSYARHHGGGHHGGGHHASHHSGGHHSGHRASRSRGNHSAHRPSMRRHFNNGHRRPSMHGHHGMRPGHHGMRPGHHGINRHGSHRGHSAHRGHSNFRHGMHRFHGSFRHLSGHNRALWRGGRWHHGWHAGRQGWWWLVAGVWYLYSAPIYPFPELISDIAYAAGGDYDTQPYDDGGDDYNDDQY